MMKIINIGDKEVPMKVHGGTLRLYKSYFHRDLLNDLLRLEKFKDDDTLSMSEIDIGIFEDLAWLLSKTADSDIPDIEKWLSQFPNPLDILNSSADVLELVFGNIQSTVESKKNLKKTVSQR